MAKVLFSQHALFRMRLRKISRRLCRKIANDPDLLLEDHATGSRIALKEVSYFGRLREVIVVFDEREGLKRIITTHPLKKGQKEARLVAGRWRLQWQKKPEKT